MGVCLKLSAVPSLAAVKMQIFATQSIHHEVPLFYRVHFTFR